MAVGVLIACDYEAPSAIYSPLQFLVEIAHVRSNSYDTRQGSQSADGGARGREGEAKGSGRLTSRSVLGEDDGLVCHCPLAA